MLDSSGFNLILKEARFMLHQVIVLVKKQVVWARLMLED
jgi:hypothetical protein